MVNNLDAQQMAWPLRSYSFQHNEGQKQKHTPLQRKKIMFSLIFGLLIAVLDFFALADVLFSRRPFVEKVLWAIVIVMLPLLGLLLYLMMGRSTRDSDSMI